MVVTPTEGPDRQKAIDLAERLRPHAAKVLAWNLHGLGSEKTPHVRSFKPVGLAATLLIDRPWDELRRKPDPPAGPPRLLDTELGLAERFVEDSQGEIRFCTSMGEWLIWNSQRWERDQHDTVIMGRAKGVVKSLFDLTDIEDREARHKRYEFARRLRNSAEVIGNDRAGQNGARSFHRRK